MKCSREHVCDLNRKSNYILSKPIMFHTNTSKERVHTGTMIYAFRRNVMKRMLAISWSSLKPEFQIQLANYYCNVRAKHTFKIRDLGQVIAGTSTLCRHGEHGEQSQWNPGRDGVNVEPEGDPGQEDDQVAGNDHLGDVVPLAALHENVESNTRISNWNSRKI